MADKTETDVFIANKRVKSSSESTNCPSKWWNQEYHHQQIIYRIIESYYFSVLIISLVITDISLIIIEIMLDSFKIQHECKLKAHHSSKHHHDMTLEHIEKAMEILHYSSIAILTFFFIELLVKIYAFGREFWNIRRRKMEYLDAFIVITSLSIDLYFLHGEEKILGDKLLLIFAFRLWRFIRIISSVSGSIRHGEQKHKESLSKQYLTAIHRLVDIILHKTNYVENNNEDFNAILEHFQVIDTQCQSSLKELDQNHELTSLALVTQFIEELEGLENKTKESTLPAIVLQSVEV